MSKILKLAINRLYNPAVGRAILIEMGPPTPAELPAAFREGLNLFKRPISEMKLKDAWLNGLVAIEVGCWFFVGEAIGLTIDVRPLNLVEMSPVDGSEEAAVVASSRLSAIVDVCCVTGGIILITGTLVAASGIFPRNQARTRIFLECFGCCMVLVGVLLIMASIKLRTIHQGEEEQIHADYSFSRSNSSIAVSPTGTGEIQVGQQPEELLTSQLTSLQPQPSPPPPSGLSCGDHLAALETALSSVLTVSTLAGLAGASEGGLALDVDGVPRLMKSKRISESGETLEIATEECAMPRRNSRWCCLHHAIQVSSYPWSNCKAR